MIIVINDYCNYFVSGMGTKIFKGLREKCLKWKEISSLYNKGFSIMPLAGIH